MPKKRKVRLSDGALADLDDIENYIALDSPRRAKSFVRDLRVACLALGEMAERFPVAIETKAAAYRRRPFASFSIFSIVEDDSVLVVRVYSSARDLDRLFPEA